MNLYDILFTENFDTLKTSDIKNGVIDGIVSPYSIPAEDNTILALSTVDKYSNQLSNKISRLHQKYQYNIKMVSAHDLVGFKEFENRLVKAFELNDFFKNDSMIQNKLASFLTYCYASISQKSGYLVYSELAQAKKVVRMVFTKAQKLGLTFLPIEIESLLKTLLLTIFYKLPNKPNNV